MNKWIAGVVAAGAGLALWTGSYVPAQAMTAKQCSAKYKAAKSAGTLKGMKWRAFRKAECGAGATAAAAPAPANPMKAKAASSSSPASAPASSSAVFPSAISPKFAKEKPGRARMHTCLAQYHANKATNANGGLKWIQKGGGYYSQCVKRLKAK
ncbi:MAG TPA: hypothetical protein VND97_05270 [Beijerinckiaceae bacterium]|nr:hypothetical protein [Beijerinckiaceae bacterium]